MPTDEYDCIPRLLQPVAPAQTQTKGIPSGSTGTESPEMDWHPIE
jgi:hypothetical protein